MTNIKFNVIKLNFGDNPVHFATPSKDYTTSETILHSDTLYSALLDVAFNLDLLKSSDEGNYGFYLSSAFPYYYDSKNNKTYYFFPRPLITEVRPPDEYSKKWKKVKWIEKSLFEKIITNPDELQISEKNIQGEFLIPDGLEKFDSNFILKEEQPRVKVGLPGIDSEPYYVQRIYFQNNCGLFFITLFDNDEIKKIFYNILDFLKYEGFGSYRTIGFGQFTYTTDEGINISSPENSNYACTLSLFCPENKEQLFQMLKDASWQLIKRGGWITNHQYKFRKKNVTMFSEGSIFFIPDNAKNIKKINSFKVIGSILNVAPSNENISIPYPVFRYGKGIFIPVKI